MYSLSPSPDGRWLTSGSLGGNVSIWSLENGELVSSLSFITVRSILSFRLKKYKELVIHLMFLGVMMEVCFARVFLPARYLF